MQNYEDNLNKLYSVSNETVVKYHHILLILVIVISVLIIV